MSRHNDAVQSLKLPLNREERERRRARKYQSLLPLNSHISSFRCMRGSSTKRSRREHRRHPSMFAFPFCFFFVLSYILPQCTQRLTYHRRNHSAWMPSLARLAYALMAPLRLAQMHAQLCSCMHACSSASALFPHEGEDLCE